MRRVPLNPPSSSTTCSRTDGGTVSSSSSDRSLLSSSFHVSSCSAKAMARGNSSGKEWSTSTAPGSGDTPATKTTSLPLIAAQTVPFRRLISLQRLYT